VDVFLLIRHRLRELGLERKDLAATAQVTESSISRLLARKKAPPAPGRTDIYEKQMRVAILEFLDTDVFTVSVENRISFLDPTIDSWDIDLKTFGMGVVLNRRLAARGLKRFEFAEQEPQQPFAVEPGLEQFLKDTSLKWRCHRRGNRVSEGAEVQRKGTFPNLFLPGAAKPEGSAPFPARSATRRIRWIEAVRGPQGSKGKPHERNF
jgi:hypothetical protein